MPSSVISDFRYAPQNHRLDVAFVNGRRYAYHDVPARLAEAMQCAVSKGVFFNRYIRDRFRFTRED